MDRKTGKCGVEQVGRKTGWGEQVGRKTGGGEGWSKWAEKQEE